MLSTDAVIPSKWWQGAALPLALVGALAAGCGSGGSSDRAANGSTVAPSTSGTGTTPPTPHVCVDTVTQIGSATEDLFRGVAHDTTTGLTYVAAHSDTALGGLPTLGGTDAYVQALDKTGQVQWTAQLGTTGEDKAIGVAIDPSSGQIVVVGYSDSDLGGTNAGSQDVFVAKLDPQGQQLWASRYGTTRDERAFSVVVSPSGTITLCGTARDPSTGSSQDPFVVQFDGSGVQQWSWIKNTWYNDPAKDVAVDASTGDVYLIGRSQAFFPGAPQPTPNSNNPANIAVGDILVVKLDSAGNEVWIKQIGSPSPSPTTTVIGSGHDLAGGVAVDSAGNIYISGFSQGDADGPGSYLGPVTQAIRQDWSSWGDAVVFKLDPAGTILWTKQFGTPESDWAYDLQVTNNGKVYVAGFTKGDMTGSGTNAGGIDVFVSALSSTGTFEWTKQYGTSGDDMAYSLACDGVSELFVVGFTAGDLDGTGPGTHAGDKDGFLIKVCD